MAYWDKTERWDEETEGVVTVRGPYDTLLHEQNVITESFEVSYRHGCPPSAFAVADPARGELCYARVDMADCGLSTNDEQLIFACAVRYAMGRATYMPSLVAGVLREHMAELRPTIAALIARDIREEWCRWYGESGKPLHEGAGLFYASDWGCFTSLLTALDDRASECYGRYGSPTPPIPYATWDEVPKEVRWDG